MIYFFYGDEEFNISNEIKKFRQNLDENFAQMNYKIYNSPKFPDLIAIIKSQPMMFGKMLIIINCLDYFSTKKKTDSGFDDTQLKELEVALNSCDENIDIIFVAQIPPDSQKKIDKRKKIFKLFSKYNPKEFTQIPSYKTTELEAWIKQQAKAKDIKITDNAISQMLIQIGANLRLLDSELEKLKVYANNQSVTEDTVKEICVSNEDLFGFIDCLTIGNKAKALEEYKKLLSKKHPLEILSTLQTMLHKSIQLKAYSTQFSSDEIAQMVGMHPYRTKLEIQKLKNVSLKNLVKLKTKLTDTEYKIKSGQSVMDIETEVEYAILQ